jgi:hypothetical protein
VGARTGLEDAEKRKSCPCWDSNFYSSVVQLSDSRYTDCNIPSSEVPAYNYFIISATDPGLSQEDQQKEHLAGKKLI